MKKQSGYYYKNDAKRKAICFLLLNANLNLEKVVVVMSTKYM